MAHALESAGLRIVPIDVLLTAAGERHPTRMDRSVSPRVVGVVEYRDGSVIDVIREATRAT